MTDELTPGDADEIAGFADRCGRIAETARRHAPANPHACGMLLIVAARAEGLAAAARTLANWIEHNA